MSNLSLETEEDLLNEICKRYDHICITGMKLINDKSDYIQLRRHEGNRMINISQIELMKNKLIEVELNSAYKLEGNQDR